MCSFLFGSSSGDEDDETDRWPPLNPDWTRERPSLPGGDSHSLPFVATASHRAGMKLLNVPARVHQLLDLYGLGGTVRVLLALTTGRPVPVPSLGVLLPADRSVGYHVAVSVPKIIRLAQYVEPGDTVFDLGAHAGLFTVAAARRGAKVIAVEPDPDVAALLRSNTRGMDVHVVEAAIADHREGATLWKVPALTQTSSLLESVAQQFGPAEPLSVQTLTLDDLVQRFEEPQVIKVDIQGLESNILSSASVVDRARVLLVEITTLDPESAALAEELAERLRCSPIQVNEVLGGHDVAFVRGPR